MWGIYTGQKKSKKQVVNKLFPKRKQAINNITKLKELGIEMPLYTKKTRGKK